MWKKKQGSGILDVLSSLAMLAAVGLLIYVCGTCYPEIGLHLRTWIGGLEGNPVQEAFLEVTEGLEGGRPVRETLSDAVYLLWEYVR